VTDSGDRQVIEAQIGRPLRSESEVVSRCHLDLPVVIRVPPLLDDGTPFPTLYWLSCPLAATRIGRLEGAGGVKRMEAKAMSDQGFETALEQAHRSYEAERNTIMGEHDALGKTEGPRPTGGVGGTRVGVKCLHAHYAHTRAGGANPVGEVVSNWIEPLDCTEVCVVGDERNPEWVNRP